MRTEVLVVITLASASAANNAQAQDASSLRGIELALRAGYGNFGGIQEALNLAPGTLDSHAFALDANLGFRTSARYSFGLHLAGAFFTQDDASAARGDDASGRALSLGLYWRWYYLSSRLARAGWDPWLGLGVDFVSRAIVSGTSGRDGFSAEVVTSAASFPVSVGVDFLVINRLAVGLSATFNPWLGDEICASYTSRGRPERECDRDNGSYLGCTGFCIPTTPNTGTGITWSISVGARYTHPR